MTDAAPRPSWDKIFPIQRIERKLKLNMGKVLTYADLCAMLKMPNTPEARMDLVHDCVKLAEEGKAMRFWVGGDGIGAIGYAAKQPNPDKDPNTGLDLPPPVYEHIGKRPIKEMA